MAARDGESTGDARRDGESAGDASQDSADREGSATDQATGDADRAGDATARFDPAPGLAAVRAATDRLLATAARLDDAAVAAPSLLPGWTRGHVLTHLARSADGMANLLVWARTGVATPMYGPGDARERDIAAGAHRPAADQLADLRASADRFAAAAGQVPPTAWDADLVWRHGVHRPASAVPWARMCEVELHHVDLLAGYRPGNWSAGFVADLLADVVRSFATRVGTPEFAIVDTTLPPPVTAEPVGAGTGGPVVSGTAVDLVAWLTGRADGARLQVDGGSLPELPPWR